MHNASPLPRVCAFLLSILILSHPCTVLAQSGLLEDNPVFDDTVVPAISIQLDEADLDRIFAPGNEESDDEYPARFTMDWGNRSETVEQVGFRLRGNTSRFSRKKSFKVSFNTFEPGRKFMGLEKLNINGEHNDPSIIRSKLSWDIFQELNIPSSRANHVRLFINGTYYGLYINVEHIDEQFLQTRFGNDDGNLYKCLYPADLTYRGDNPDAYKPGPDRRPYDLKLKDSDDEGYDDLAELIRTINLTPDGTFMEALESFFDVDSFLKVMAVDVAVGSWDDYWTLMNNYYLYFDPETGRFTFIPYDYDNTFGIDFLGRDWGNQDVYNWGNFNGEARPLADRILAVGEYRDRYSYYLRQILEGPLDPSNLFPRIDALYNMIAGAAADDTFRTFDYGYTLDDFNNSYTQGLGGHVPYGLKEFVETRRASAFQQLEDVNIIPILRTFGHTPRRPQVDDPIRFFARIDDDDTGLNVQVLYQVNNGSSQNLMLFDDGQHDDGSAGDGLYAGVLPALNESGSLSYRLRIIDPARNSKSTEPVLVQIGYTVPNVFINEWMASNATSVSDEAGEFDDWIELYNGEADAFSLNGYFLTDNLDVPDKWALPDVSIPPAGYLLLWIDGDPEQGPLHAPFRLEMQGEQIGLFDPTLAPVDTLTFGEMPTDTAMGRESDGSEVFVRLDTPTPGASNGMTNVGVESDPLPLAPFLSEAYPNPFGNHTQMQLHIDRDQHVDVSMYDVQGRKVRSLFSGPMRAHNTHTMNITPAMLPDGLYVVQARGTSFVSTRKILLVR